MGPAYEIGNQYLISKDTGNELYSGARQYENPRPNKINSSTYIGQAPEYTLKFGNLQKKSNKKKNVNITINIKQKRK